MPEVAPTITIKQLPDQSTSIGTSTTISLVGSNMKKDKTLVGQDRDQDSTANEDGDDQNEVYTDPSHIINSGNGSSNTIDSTIGTKSHDKQDAEMSLVSSESILAEHDTPMTDVTSRDTNGAGTTEGISQEDLDGGLLDGALDDYDDLDQDTEDTEVGNGEDDFSDDDDDDDDDDNLNSKAVNKMVQSGDEMSLGDSTKSEDRDMDTADESTGYHGKDAPVVHSEDSDSDLPEPDGSDNEHEDDDDEEEDEEEDRDEDGDDDGLEDEDDEPVKKPVETRKDSIASQKPVLNRPPATEEELKDSGDELSDLSEFDDTDDSDDDDDDVPETKPTGKDSNINTATTAPAPLAQGNGKPTPAGRKRSLHDSGKDVAKQVQETVKTEQVDPIEVPNGRARLMERKAPEIEDEHHSDKESGSEAHEEEEEEEEEEEKVVEEEEEEEEDMETKQLHKDALEALTSIEVEFANLRDKYGYVICKAQ
ncbi:hypothetical protein BGZ76_005100 [Entomortierella beljakovae]|nr:hypothetical protein BGZ76_005100 [Entomortierella beljakovae]